MPTPERLSDNELSISVMALARRFISRWDMYPKQLPDGRYVSISEPLSVSELYAHLRGELTLGTYLLDRHGQARFIVLDADTSEGLVQLKRLTLDLMREGIPGYIETSRRGGHVWLFFDKALPGSVARQFGKGVIKNYELAGVEVYPKQDRLKTGPGSLIRLPFGVHQLTGRRYGFVTPEGEPLASTLRTQLKLLSFPNTVSATTVKHYQGLTTHEGETRADFVPSDELTGLVSERIKAAITVGEFVSRFVALKATGSGGVGHCPFHEDTHPSFGVHDAGNYWSCFAGCGGGSIIDFWMKWRGIDFRTAIKELAEMVL